MNVDLVIKNSKIYLDGMVQEGGIAVNEGKIVSLGKEVNLPQGDSQIDAVGNLVIPGLIDIHVHFRDPGFVHKEDFFTGSQAAASGGVTTVVDEPNNIPPIVSVEALKEKKRMAERKSVIDFSFNVGLNPHNLSEIPDFRREGIFSFDIFSDGLGDELSIRDNWTILKALKGVKETEALACLNCGDSTLTASLSKKLKESGGKSLGDYGKSSPPIAESLGALKNILLALDSGTRVHLRQISAQKTVTLIERLRGESSNITTEASPHHLLINIEEAECLGPFGKVNPPIRSKMDMETLWSAFVKGTIDMLATDHAPHTREEKNSGSEEIWRAPSGLPGIETMLPLMLTQVNRGRLSLGRLVEASSEIPSKTVNLSPRKGVIRIGSDADLVIVDMQRETKITRDMLHSKIDWTPFENWIVEGVPVMTIIRGEKVFEEGEILQKPGYGNFTAS